MLHDVAIVPFHPEHIKNKEESFFKDDKFFNTLKYYMREQEIQCQSVFYNKDLLMITGERNFDDDVVLYWIHITKHATKNPKKTVEVANALHLLLGAKGYNKIIFTVDYTNKINVNFANHIRTIKREGISRKYRMGKDYLIYGGHCGSYHNSAPSR